MKPNQFFRLIKSFSDKEKKEFIKERLMDKNVLLLSLFNLLDKLYEYDKIEIKNQLIKLKINIGSYQYLKFQLQNEVLEYLMKSYCNTSAYEQINKLILKAKIMQQRQLFELSLELIQEAEELAKKYDSQLQLLSIYDLKNNIYVSNAQNRLQEISNKLFENKNEELRKYQCFSELQEVHAKEFFKHNYNRLQVNEDEKIYLLSLYEKIENNRITSFAINDYKVRLINIISQRLAIGQVDSINKARIKLWEQFEHIKNEHKDRFLKLLLTHFNKSCKARKFHEADQIIHKIEGTRKELTFINKTEEADYYNSKLTTLVMRNDLKSAEKLMHENKELLNSVDNDVYNADINRACQYTIAHTYFCLKDYKKALKYCNNILNKPKNERAFHVLITTRLLKLIILYESKDLVQLYDFSKALYMYFRRLPHNYEFELYVHSCINSLSKCDDEEERKIILTKMKDEIAQQSKTKAYGDSALFHFIPWIDSHLQKKNYSQVLEEVARNEYPSIFELKF